MTPRFYAERSGCHAAAKGKSSGTRRAAGYSHCCTASPTRGRRQSRSRSRRERRDASLLPRARDWRSALNSARGRHWCGCGRAGLRTGRASWGRDQSQCFGCSPGPFLNRSPLGVQKNGSQHLSRAGQRCCLTWPACRSLSLSVYSSKQRTSLPVRLCVDLSFLSPGRRSGWLRSEGQVFRSSTADTAPRV